MSFLSSSISIELRDAYLDRLGLEAEPPSANGLRRLHRRHVEEVPYETLWSTPARRLCPRTSGVSCARGLRTWCRPDLVRGIRRSW